MGYIKLFITSLAVIMVLSANVEGQSSRCPPRNQVLNRKVCKQDWDCSHGQVCCPNSSNTKSCAVPTGYDPGHSKNGGGPGVYCDGVKCSPFEVCKPDPITKRLKCQRA